MLGCYALLINYLIPKIILYVQTPELRIVPVTLRKNYKHPVVSSRAVRKASASKGVLVKLT